MDVHIAQRDGIGYCFVNACCAMSRYKLCRTVICFPSLLHSALLPTLYGVSDRVPFVVARLGPMVVRQSMCNESLYMKVARDPPQTFLHEILQFHIVLP